MSSLRIKILVLGSFGIGALENYYVEGFEESGHLVNKFDINESYNELISRSLINKVVNFIIPSILIQDINHRLSLYVKEKFFDLILIFKGSTLFPATVTYLKTKTKLIGNYNPDHPFVYYTRGSGNSFVKNSIPLYDLHFSYSQNIVDKLKNTFGVEAFFIPFGYRSLLALNNFNSVKLNSFLFVGAYDRERARVLSSVYAKDLIIYGDNKWNTKTRNTDIQSSFRNMKLYGEELKIKTEGSLGVINILRQQNLSEESHNMRTFEVPACGGVLISAYTSEQAKFFEPNKEALYYKSEEELKDIMEKIRIDHKFSSQIKRNAFLRCEREDYSYRKRAKTLISIVTQYL